MSDTQGHESADQTTPMGDQPRTPNPDAQSVQPAQPAAQPTPPLRPSAPGVYSVYPQPGYPQPGTPQPRTPQPGTPQQGYPSQPGYAAQPGAAFGAAASARPFETQPTTLPLAPGATVTAGTAEKQKSGAGKIVALLVAAALVGGAAGLGGAYAGIQLAGTEASSQSTTNGGGTVVVNNTDSVNEITGIAVKVTPSVVTIQVASGSSSGTGSGVILTDDGYVVTNTHVVTLDGASDSGAISVTTSDGRIYAAEIVGLDPIYDLAVIKLVDAEGLAPIEFASSSRLNVGDVAVAVGAPLGLANTVTTGIVSALNRSIEIQSSAVPDTGGSDEDGGGDGNQQNGPFQFDFPGQQQRQQQGSSETIKISVIQTDAAINPGNSGGALVDADGKLIGINVAIATAGSAGEAGSIGVGFSIPSDIVKRVTDEIIADGSATHGLLGASVQSAGALEDATIAGAYIAEVSSGGAAEAAGLREGDIVTAFNGTPVSDSVDLTALVRSAAAGSDATVTYVRDGKTATVDVTLGALTQ